MYGIGVLIINAIAAGFVAWLKGYNPVMWFIAGFFVPPVPLIIITFLPSQKQRFGARQPESQPQEQNLSEFNCVSCGKSIPLNAAQCPHCGYKYEIIDTGKPRNS